MLPKHVCWACRAVEVNCFDCDAKVTLNQVGQHMEVTHDRHWCAACFRGNPWIDRLQPYADLVADDEFAQLASEPVPAPTTPVYVSGDTAAGQPAGAVDPEVASGIPEIESPNAAATLTLPVRDNQQDAEVHESSRTAFRAELEAHVAAGYSEWPQGHPELGDL